MTYSEKYPEYFNSKSFRIVPMSKLLTPHELVEVLRLLGELRQAHEDLVVQIPSGARVELRAALQHFNHVYQALELLLRQPSLLP